MEKDAEEKGPKATASGTGSRASSADRPGFRTLDKKNKELSNATKQLEEKVANLAQKSSVGNKPGQQQQQQRSLTAGVSALN